MPSKLGLRTWRPAKLVEVEGIWPMFFLLVVLKVPILGTIYLLWWAAQPAPDQFSEEDGADDPGRRRPRPKFPRGPRRDPHGDGAKPLPSGATHGGRIRQADPARALDRSRSREIVRK